MYELRTTSRFKKDFKRCKNRGKNLAKLKAATELLTETGTLPAEYVPHPLRGEYKDCIDAHLEPDWILIYRPEADNLITLIRTGTHADLFR